jgi:sugar lactone lactonase YvrE
MRALRPLLAIVIFALEPGCANAPQRLRALDVVARSDRQWTGVGVSQEGRIFVNYPRWGGAYEHAVEEVLSGGERIAYPDETWNEWSDGDDPAARFVCVQSVYVDDADRLWVLDPAAPNFRGPVAGGAKLVRINLETDEVERIYRFDETIAPPGSYLNDVRVDVDAGAAFITDSGRGAIVVLDLRSGRARRLLADHPSTKAEPGVVPVIEGRPLTAGADPTAPTPQIHSDGLALDTRFGYLYYQALTARTLHRVPTSALLDTSLPKRELEARVENLGRTVVTDGMILDDSGRLFFSALEENAIIYRERDGGLHTLARHPQIAWPDSFALGPGGTLYVTTSQIHRTPPFTGGEEWPDTPCLLLRAPLP